MSFKIPIPNFRILFLCPVILLYVCLGVIFAILPPIFPNEALKRENISLQYVSFIMMCYDVSKVISSAFLALFIQPTNQLNFFCFGVLSSSIVVTLFGLLPVLFDGIYFVLACIFAVLFQGFADSCIFLTGIPIFSALFPGFEARVISAMESSIGIGIMIGPAIASSLYYLGGYPLPFISVGSTMFLIAIVCVIISSKGDSNTFPENGKSVEIISKEKHEGASETVPTFRKCSLCGFIRTPSIFLVNLPVFMMAACSACIGVTLGPHLLDNFGVSSHICGYYFLCFGLTYTAGAFLIGFLGDRGYSFHCPLIFLLMGGLGYLSFYIINFLNQLNSKYTILSILAIEGFSHVGGAFVPAFTNVEKISQLEGFGDLPSVKLTTSTLVMLTYSLGRIAGSYLMGGLVSGYFGFHIGMLAISVSVFISWGLFWIPILKHGILIASPKTSDFFKI